MAVKKAKEQCECKPGMGIIASILSVVGIYSIILGIKVQWAGASDYTNVLAMVYYLIGVLVMALAKMSKHKAYCNCEKHKM